MIGVPAIYSSLFCTMFCASTIVWQISSTETWLFPLELCSHISAITSCSNTSPFSRTKEERNRYSSLCLISEPPEKPARENADLTLSMLFIYSLVIITQEMIRRAVDPDPISPLPFSSSPPEWSTTALRKEECSMVLALGRTCPWSVGSTGPFSTVDPSQVVAGRSVAWSFGSCLLKF